jgi:uridine kinase
MTQLPNYVIAISSVSGGGKTTLVKKAVECLCGTALFFDDYASVSNYPENIKKWLKGGADVNQWKTPQFARDVHSLRSGDSIVSPVTGKKILPSEFIVIEEPMGRERLEMNPLIDFVVVIDTPLEIALARRLLRDRKFFIPEGAEREERLAESYLQAVEHTENLLIDYLDNARDLYIAVQTQAIENCDLVIDGTMSIDAAIQQLISAVEKKSERNIQYNTN